MRKIRDSNIRPLYGNLEELSKIITGLVQRFEVPKDR
jgi:hypothetical protein